MKGNNRTYYKRIKNILICIGLALFFINLIPSSVVLAKGRFKPEWVMPAHYPDGFDGWGRIDRIAEDEVVIDDRSWPLSAFVEYHSPTAMNVSRYLFSSGNLVGYLMNSKREIISLWLIVME